MTKLIKHRCNSKDEIHLASVNGYAGVELDVQFTKNGKAVMCHDKDDPELENREALRTLISKTTWRPIIFVEIKRCYWHRANLIGLVYTLERLALYHDIKVISFSQKLLDALPDTLTKACIEICPNGYRMDLPDGTASTFDKSAEYFIA